jgi:hypothetical protein
MGRETNGSPTKKPPGINHETHETHEKEKNMEYERIVI